MSTATDSAAAILNHNNQQRQRHVISQEEREWIDRALNNIEAPCAAIYGLADLLTSIIEMNNEINVDPEVKRELDERKLVDQSICIGFAIQELADIISVYKQEIVDILDGTELARHRAGMKWRYPEYSTRATGKEDAGVDR